MSLMRAFLNARHLHPYASLSGLASPGLLSKPHRRHTAGNHTSPLQRISLTHTHNSLHPNPTPIYYDSLTSDRARVARKKLSGAKQTASYEKALDLFVLVLRISPCPAAAA